MTASLAFSLYLRQSGHDVFVRRSDPIIHLDELPLHHPFPVDDKRRRVSDLPATGIGIVEKAVSIDHPVSFVGQEGKTGSEIIVGGNPVHHAPQILRGIHREGEDLRSLFLFLGQQGFQLHELLGAVGSPVPPVEHEDHVLRASKTRKGEGIASQRLEREIRRHGTNGHPLEIRRR